MGRNRRGEVFISPVDAVPADGSMVDPAVARFWVSWQDEGESWPLEDDEVEEADAAIAWGRERSPIVWIRLGNRGDTYFSAGDEHPLDDDPEEAVPHWPPSEPPSAGWWTVPAVPSVVEIEAMNAALRSGAVTSEEATRWADERLSALMGVEGEPDRETLLALLVLRGEDVEPGPA